MHTEKELIIEMKHGNKDAFEKIIEKYQNRIFTLCYRYTGNKEDAEDLAQDVFVKLFKKINQYNNKSSFSTWLFQIGNNTCKDFLRKKQKESQIKIADHIWLDDEEVKPERFIEKKTPESQLEDKEKMLVLKETINKLTPEYKMVIIMREFQDLSYEEISHTLNYSVGTIKSRLSRARKALKEKYKEVLEER